MSGKILNSAFLVSPTLLLEKRRLLIDGALSSQSYLKQSPATFGVRLGAFDNVDILELAKDIAGRAIRGVKYDLKIKVCHPPHAFESSIKT